MAIDDNTSYELTGAQVKDLASKINAKADTTDLPSVMTGATSSTAGASGLVPAPAAGDEAKVLSGAGTWVAQSGGGSTYTAGNGISISANDEISIDTSVVAELSDLPTVNDGTLTIQHNGTTKGTFTANQSTASTVNIETIYADDYISTSPIPTTVTTAMIENGAVTTAKIDDEAVTAAKTAFGGNYSTSEVNTGFTWIDGKPIYKKTVNFGQLPNATSKRVSPNISNLERVVDMRAMARGQNINTPLPYVGAQGNANQIEMFLDSTGEIMIATGDDKSFYTECYVTLWYTKSS